jgi:hypothetical protein
MSAAVDGTTGRARTAPAARAATMLSFMIFILTDAGLV